MYKTREVRVCSTDYGKVDQDFETKCNKIRKKKGSTNDETIFFSCSSREGKNYLGDRYGRRKVRIPQVARLLLELGRCMS